MLACLSPLAIKTPANTRQTQIALGVEVQLTLDAMTQAATAGHPTPSSTPGLPAISPSPTLYLPPKSPTPQASATAVFTPTLQATLTPLPTIHVPTIPTAPCNLAALISETVPGGSGFMAGQYFDKTWKLQNIGSCSWTPAYSLAFVGGTAMNSDADYKLNTYVLPGQMVNLTIRLRAPANNGSFTGQWMLRSDNNILFGLKGPPDQQTVRVTINAIYPNTATVTPTPTSTPNPEPLRSLDFIDTLCNAQWRSDAGKDNVFSQCPETDYHYAWALRAENPKFEGEREDDEPALWLHPEQDFIEGTYPEYTVKSGDRFRSYVGCAYGYSACKVTFQLLYQMPDKSIEKLKEWQEISDGEIHTAEADLTPLTGKTVQFILLVRNDGNINAAQAYWLAPRIMSAAPTPTMTASPTPTSTSTATGTPSP